MLQQHHNQQVDSHNNHKENQCNIMQLHLPPKSKQSILLTVTFKLSAAKIYHQTINNF